MWQIGAEGGLFGRAGADERLVLAPAERADVLVDFRGSPGETLCQEPPARPGRHPGAAADAGDADPGRRPPAGRADDSATLPGRAGRDLRARRSRPGSSHSTRSDVDTPNWRLTLNGRPFMDDAPGVETPRSARRGLVLRQPDRRHPPDAHAPVHVPGRRPGPVRRRRLRGGRRRAPAASGGIDPTPYATGPMRPLTRPSAASRTPSRRTPARSRSSGPFDLPAGVTPPQSYVFHCHIVEHEDNEMMRPFIVHP